MALPRIEIEVGADTAQAESGLRRTSAELDNFGNAVDRASARSGGIDTAMGKVTRSSGALQNSIRNASFQISDFAVQVSSGQAATTALAQQLPQLIGGFGTLGAVLSAVVPIAIAVGVGMKAAANSGKDVTSIFGTLTPVAESLAASMKAVGAVMVSVAETVINNLDRILITAGLVAGFMAGKWVVGFVAARVATFSLAAALTTLRTALIRTGIGALVVAAGELVYQFTRLAKAAGGFGEAFAQVGELFKEIIGRMGAGMQGLYQLAKGAAQGIAGAFVQAAANIIAPFQDAFNFIASGFNALASKAGMDQIQMPQATFSSDLGSMADGLFSSARDSAAGAKDAFGVMTAPLEGLQKIRETIAGMKEDKLTLDDILGGGGDDDEEGGGKSKAKSKLDELDEELTAQEERIKAHFDRIKALTTGGLSDKLGAWGNYFTNLASLTGSNNAKLLQMGKSFSAAMALVDSYRAYTQALADPTIPTIGKIAAAGQVLAAGLGAVNSIKGVSSAGASASSSGSAASASTASSSRGSSSAASSSGSSEVIRKELSINVSGNTSQDTDTIMTTIQNALNDGWQLTGVSRA